MFPGDLDSDEPEMVYNARQKMASLSSCFAQLTHKAQTIFQSNAKNEVGLSIKASLFCCFQEQHTFSFKRNNN